MENQTTIESPADTADATEAGEIKKMMAAGLSREQALEVLRQQLAHDAALANPTIPAITFNAEPIETNEPEATK